MSADPKWSKIYTLIGWTIESHGGPDNVKNAHLKRHPRHCSYIPIEEVKPLSQSESEKYGLLNGRLHEELRRVSKEHFAGTPAPPGVDPKHWMSEYFTPFTYQNTDWYGPSYECYIVVRTDYISADLLRIFQSLLIGDFQDWCIQVVGSKTPDFGNDFEIAIFSDQVIVPIDAVKALGAPKAAR